MSLLEQVAERAAADSPLWRGALLADPVAAEPVTGCPDGLALGVEMIREGFLLHRGRARLFSTEDADLALLTGDYLYAAGLVEVCRQGDPRAVEILAELIAGCALAQGNGEPDAGESLWTPALAALVALGRAQCPASKIG